MKNLLKTLLITALIFTGCTGTGTTGEEEAAPSIPEVTDADWSKGNLESTVVLVEYSDLQCPACKAREPIVEQLLEEFGNHIRFVYRHRPLNSIHANAQLASQAAEAAGLQGKFWEMHDLLFEKQSDWSVLSKSELIAAFTTYAEELALDVTKFQEHLESSEVEDLVNEDSDGADDSGINSTPSFYLNGEAINPKTYEEYREVIRQAIEA